MSVDTGSTIVLEYLGLGRPSRTLLRYTGLSLPPVLNDGSPGLLKILKNSLIKPSGSQSFFESSLFSKIINISYVFQVWKLVSNIVLSIASNSPSIFFFSNNYYSCPPFSLSALLIFLHSESVLQVQHLLCCFNTFKA